MSQEKINYQGLVLSLPSAVEILRLFDDDENLIKKMEDIIIIIGAGLIDSNIDKQIETLAIKAKNEVITLKEIEELLLIATGFLSEWRKGKNIEEDLLKIVKTFIEDDGEDNLVSLEMAENIVALNLVDFYEIQKIITVYRLSHHNNLKIGMNSQASVNRIKNAISKFNKI